MQASFSSQYSRQNFLLTSALAAFILAIVSFTSFLIEDYNHQIQSQEIELKTKANHGIHFAVDTGPDYPPRHRLLLIVLTFFILMAVWKLDNFISFLIMLLPLPIYIFWFITISREIGAAEFYMTESPYLLKIATYNDYLVLMLILMMLFCANFYITCLFLQSRKD